MFHSKQDKISSIGTHVSNDVIGFRPEYQRAVKDRLLDKLKEKRNQEKNPKAVKSLDEKIEKLENSTGAIDPVNQVSRMRKLYDSALILTGDLGPANEFVNPVKAEQSLHEAKSISCTGFTKSFRDLGDIICDDPEFREELAMSPNLQDRGTVCSYSPVSKDKSIKQISPKYSLRLSSMPHVYTKRVSIRHVCQGEQYKPDLNGKSFRGLYDQYVDEVKNLSDITKDQKFSFRIRPKIPSFHIDSQLGKEFKRLYQQRKKYLDALKVFWDMFISFIIMMVLISAWKYHNKYLTDVTFDNIYISGYFRHIDDRRKRAGKSFKLLPIKKLDGRPELINALSLKLNSEEARQMKASFTLLIAFCFVVATVIYVDILLSTIIESYSRHMAFTVVQKGFNSVKFFVTGHPSGDGPIARAFKEAFDNFESEFNLDKPTDMKNCMPKAVFTPSSKITKIVVVLFVWVFLNLNSAYLLRIRRMTCSFFYRKREKQRILHLYNNMLSTRKKILRFKVSQAIEDKRKMLPTSSNPSLDGSNSVDLDGEECRLCQEILVDPVACSTCYSQAQGSEGVLISGSTNPTNTFYCRQCFDQLLRVCLICCSIEDFDEAFVVRK